MENQAPYLAAPEIPVAQPVTTELARLDKEIQLTDLQSKAQFALTPVGQALKRFEANQRMGRTYANSTIVPNTYNAQGVYGELLKKERKGGGPIDANALWAQAQNTALANCAIAVDMAVRINADPMMVMQNLYIVNGRPAWSSSFLISTVNTCGQFERLKFRIFEDGVIGKIEVNETVWVNREKQTVKKTFDGSKIKNLCCVAYTTTRGGKDVLESSVISCRLAVQEGWWTKDGSKWPNMTEQMLRYRAAAFWVRTYAPELSMGFHTAEEERDVINVPYTDMETGKTVEPTGYKAPASHSLAEMAMQNARNQQTETTDEPDSPAQPVEQPVEASAPTKENTQAPANVDPATGEVLFPEV